MNYAMPYCVSKVVAFELGPHKIRVNSVCPTQVNTDIDKQLDNELCKHEIYWIPIGHMC